MIAGQRTECREGFTLIEVVVALALGVVLVVAVQSMVVAAYRTHNDVQRRADEAALNSLPFELLQHDLHNLPASGGIELREGVLSFVTLNALQSNRIAARHAVIVQYIVETEETDAVRLQRREREPADEDAARGAIVADGLTHAAFAVFDGREWHDQWPLPVARQARALRLILDRPLGERSERIIRLAPLRWSRHDG